VRERSCALLRFQFTIMVVGLRRGPAGWLFEKGVLAAAPASLLARAPVQEREKTGVCLASASLITSFPSAGSFYLLWHWLAPVSVVWHPLSASARLRPFTFALKGVSEIDIIQ
jgi:hypothetical protein